MGTNTTQRLATAISLFELLKMRRRNAGDPNLGSSIERQLIGRELRELEEQIILNPGPLAKYVAVTITDRIRAAHKR